MLYGSLYKSANFYFRNLDCIYKVRFQKPTFPRHLIFKTSVFNFSSLVKLNENSSSQLTTLQQQDWQRIHSKFQFEHIKTIREIFQTLRKSRSDFELNELIYILKHIASIYQNTPHSSELDNYNDEFGKMLSKMKIHLRDTTQDYPFIGTMANSLKQLKHTKDSELWYVLGDYFTEDRANVSREEVLLAVSGFISLPKITDVEFADRVYDKLEELIERWNSQINLKETYEACKTFHILKRKTAMVQSLIENSFPRNLASRDDMINASIQAVISIAYFHSDATFISDSFLRLFQDVLLVKFENKAEKLSGKLVSYLAYILSYWKGLDRESAIDARLMEKFKQSLLDKSLAYELHELTRIHKSLSELEINSDSIKTNLNTKLFLVEKAIDYSAIVDYVMIKAKSEHEGQVKKIPKETFAHLDRISCRIIEESNALSIVNYVSWLEDNNLMILNLGFMSLIPKHVIHKIVDYDFEQMCYFYLIFCRHKEMFKKLPEAEVEYNMGILKDYIKMYWVTIPRGRLGVTSNYYRILEIVDIHEFNQRGVY